MAITLEPVTLDSNCGDEEGMLALRDGRVIAVLARLGALHDDQVGRWFVEAAFTRGFPAGEIYLTLSDFVARATARSAE
jgi:hypothetical protein|uniref:hypothetical protein n=1 Tax=uncultured Sphingomonas sp. TaxID=158754 RepID=UPI0035CB8D1B